MVRIGLICEASVPEQSFVSIEVREDIDGDGEVENSSTHKIVDGTHKYLLDGFDGNRNNKFSTQIHLERESANQNPSVSRIDLLIPGASHSTRLNPRTIADKHREASFFFTQFENGPEEFSRYFLGAFLRTVRSIDEIFEKDTEFGVEDWSDSEAEIALSEFIDTQRQKAVHLVRPASTLRPSTGHSQSVDFGSSKNDTGAEWDLVFSGVPRDVIDELVPSSTFVELAGNTTNQPNAPAARSVPAVPLCKIYLKILEERFQDWLKSEGHDEFLK